jgi:hypothetical protein
MDPRITRLRELARNEAVWEMGRLLKGRFQPAYCGGSEFISVEELHGFIDRITKEMVEGNSDSDAVFKALDKQTAKNVIPLEGYETIKCCPVCKRDIIYSAKYCFDCGQKVSWEDYYASRTDASSDISGVSGEEMAEESKQDV